MNTMKLKANQHFYKNVLIAFAGLIIFMGSLGYFLGFDINTKSLLYYLLFILLTISIFVIIFIIIDSLNPKYIIFDDEKIIVKDEFAEKIIVYFNQILYTKYHNSIDLTIGSIDWGYVEIVYQINNTDNEPKHLNLYLSKKNYKSLFKH